MTARLAPTSVETAWTELALGHLQQLAGRSDEADARQREALELFASHGEAEEAMAARLALASALADRGRVSEAITLAREALEQGRAARRDDVIAWASGILGMFLAAGHDLDGARAAYEQGRDAAARMGSDVYLAMAHRQLAMVELMADRPEDAGANWDAPRRSTAAPRTSRASAMRWRSQPGRISPTATSRMRPTRQPSHSSYTTRSGCLCGRTAPAAGSVDGTTAHGERRARAPASMAIIRAGSRPAAHV